MYNLPAAEEKGSVEMLNYFSEKGGNFIDTSDMYLESEDVIGNWLSSKKREDFVIATKVGGTPYPLQTGGNQLNRTGLSRKHMLESVEDSLKRLKTNYIDLYQTHISDPDTPVEETMRTFNDLVRSGKIRYIGISNWTGIKLQKAIDFSKYMGMEKIVCIQSQYNLLCRTIEWDLIPMCLENNISVICWSPLAGGWLSGKQSKDKAASGSRVDWAEKAGWQPTSFSSKSGDKTWNILDTVSQISKETGMTSAQVSLRWLTQKPAVTAPIIGARTIAQLKDNMECLSKELSTDQMKRLDEASSVGAPYPWVLNG